MGRERSERPEYTYFPLFNFVRMKLKEFYQFVETKIGSGFAAYGRFASRHAWKILALTIIVNAGLAVGMLKLQSDIDAQNVYLPQGTQARKDQDRLQSVFPDLSGSNFQKRQMATQGAFASVYIRSKTGNLLNRTVLQELSSLNDDIQAITATNDDGSAIVFSSICAKVQGRCAVQGDLFWSTEFLAAVDGNNVTYPLFTYSAGTRNYAGDLGGDVRSNTTHLQGTQLVRIEYRFRTDIDYEDTAKNWCDKFIDFMTNYNAMYFEVTYAHFRSLDEELDKNVAGDIALFSITITLMLTYSCFATYSSRLFDMVGQRVMLGFGGLLASGLAIAASFGFCAAIGVNFVSIVGVVPFLVAGIGIDDMFILLSGLSGAQKQLTIEGKIGETMRASGVGITITSLTDFIAFMAGAGSAFVAVKNFCIYTGVAVVFCYINNITLFCACMTIHERRVEQNRHFFTCRRIKTKAELRSEGKSKQYVVWCGGRPPTSRAEAESLLDKLPRWLIPKLVLKFPIKIGILFLFAGYLAAAIYGCINLRQGLKFQELVSDDSYFYKYSDWQEWYFSRQTVVSYNIDQTYKYSDATTQSNIEDFLAYVKADSYFDGSFEVFWLSTYKSTNYYDASSEANFIAGLQTFLSQTEFSMFENDVRIDTANNLITASRMYVKSRPMSDSQDEGKLMLKSRELADNAPFDCYAFSPAYIAYEQYVAILGQTLMSVGIALAAVFVITCIFMPHPLLVVLCTVAVTMIMVGVFGFIHYIDVALSSITMIHMIMSIGFSIDFTAHVCHGFMISDGESRARRVEQAIEKTGAPIFHGAVSSIVGVVVLVAAKSYIFRTFAAVMSFVLVFGIAHALLLLPVILSWIGPGRMNTVSDNENKDNRNSTSVENMDNKSKSHKNGGFHSMNGDVSKSNGDLNQKHGLPDTKFESNATTFKLEPNGKVGEYNWAEKM